MRIALPIDEAVPAIVAAVRASSALVVTAAPGAGKTTRVPPALVEDGPVLVLQPRRVAARAIAARIAAERGWTIGREVGWHVRFDRRFGDDTNLIIATEGILTARLQQDPLLTGIRTVILDEFHERSLHADVGLALVKAAQRRRPDLRIVVMSATMDAARVASYLGDCPAIDVPGRTFPLDISYRPGVSLAVAVGELLPRTSGALLCFLPGAGEIRRAAEEIAASRSAAGIPVWPLHGGLDADDQDQAIRPSNGRRIVLATNLAETTVTVADVTAVVDTGLQKIARYDAARAIDSLETERVSTDSANQRAGRAGRTQAGIAIRLWDSRDRLRPHREAEIARVDLASTVLDILAWGGDPRTLEWFEAPPKAAIDAALSLLARLGAIDRERRVTPIGKQLQRLPLHPRLGRLLIDAGGAPVAARACALLSERHFVPPRHGTTACDVLAAVEKESALPPHVLQTARAIRESARSVLGGSVANDVSEAQFRKALLAAYPDRVARRRTAHGDKLVLASGSGAKLARESGVHNAEFLVAVEVAGRTAGAAAEPIVRMASAVEREWLDGVSTEVRHTFDADSGAVKAARVEVYDAMVLSEHPAAVDRTKVGALVADAYIRRGPTENDAQLLRRLGAAGISMDFGELVRRASEGKSKLDDVRIEAALSGEATSALTRLAPATLAVSGGPPVKLDYRDDGRVVASVKLQRLFGVNETPRVGPNRTPVAFELLAPNGRPVQVTSDLASFWKGAYPAMRTQLKARYPKHKW